MSSSSLAARLALFAVVASCASRHAEVTSRPPFTASVADASADAVVDVSDDAVSAGDGASARAPVAIERGAFGTAHPTVVVAFDPSERWAALCQARADTDGDGEIALHSGYHGEEFGDDLTLYLIVGGGEGVEIDELVRSSRDGRWIVYIRAGRLLLRDMERGVETDLSALGADASDDGNPLAAHRAATFAPDSARVAYLRRRGDRTFVVVRSLPGGEERELDAGPGQVWRAYLLDAGWVEVDVVSRDTDGNGRVEVPLPHTTLSSRHCRGAPRVYGVYGWGGDRPVVRLFANGGSAPIDVTAVVTTWGDSVVARVDRTLVRIRPDGTRSTLTPASCDARVFATFSERSRSLITCTPPHAREVELQVLTEQGMRPTGIRVGVQRQDNEEEGRYADFVASARGVRRDVVFDMEALREVANVGGYLGRFGGRALVRRQSELFVRELESAVETPVSVPLDGDVWPRRYGPVIDLEGTLIDVEHARALGRVTSHPVGVNDARRALMPSSLSEEGREIGPLRWQSVEALTENGR